MLAQASDLQCQEENEALSPRIRLTPISRDVSSGVPCDESAPTTAVLEDISEPPFSKVGPFSGDDEAQEEPVRDSSTECSDSMEWNVICRAGVWYALLLAIFLFNRGWCVGVGSPNDCQDNWNAAVIAKSLWQLFLGGFVLGWFTRIYSTDRFSYLCSWRRSYFPLATTAIGPVFSGLHDIPGINWGSFSSDGDSIGYVAIVVMVLCGLGLLCVLLWHLREARSQQGLLCFLLPRLLLAVFWCTLSIAVWSSGGIVHFHHYAIAWYLAIYMQFNHPVSVLSLAVLVGVYLQGIAAYNRDEVWQDHTCWHISHSGEVMNSIFSPNDPRKDFRKLSWFQCDMKGQQLPAWWCLPGDMHVRDINCLGDA